MPLAYPRTKGPPAPSQHPPTSLAQVLLGGNRVDINGEAHQDTAASPLQIAVERGDLDIVKCLKAAGADAELARLTVATKLHKLKAGKHSRSSSALQLGHVPGSGLLPGDKGKQPLRNGDSLHRGTRSLSLSEPLQAHLPRSGSVSSMASSSDAGAGSSRSSSFTSAPGGLQREGGGQHGTRTPPLPRSGSRVPLSSRPQTVMTAS